MLWLLWRHAAQRQAHDSVVPAAAVRWVVGRLPEGRCDRMRRDPVAASTVQVATASPPASRARGAAMLDPSSAGPAPGRQCAFPSAGGANRKGRASGTSAGCRPDFEVTEGMHDAAQALDPLEQC